jgi:hypothetical protein
MDVAGQLSNSIWSPRCWTTFKISKSHRQTTHQPLRRVRQSRKHQLWRVSHPFRDGIAIRLIVWFPPESPPVIILFGNDKAQMGDVFYNSVGSRGDQVITAYLRLTDGGDDE